MSRSGRVLPLTLGLALTLTTLTYAAPARPRCLPDVVPAPFVDWFDDAVVIGDSRAQGLREYMGDPGGLWLTQMGLNVRTARTSSAFLVNGRQVSIAQALEGGSWGKIYLTLGVNEAAWIIDDLRQIQPHVPIYLQTIIPVTLSRAAARAPGNDLLAHHSQLLVRLAREKRVYLVDTAAPLTGSNGALPSDYSADGLHLSDEGNKVWLDCLRTTPRPDGRGGFSWEDKNAPRGGPPGVQAREKG